MEWCAFYHLFDIKWSKTRSGALSYSVLRIHRWAFRYTSEAEGWLLAGQRLVEIIGYADDLLLMSSTLDGLQSMVKTCEEYASTHNLTFSTNTISKKSKTKCMAFLRKERSLINIKLNGKDLPWVDSAKHLGCRIGHNNRGMVRDMMEKRAMFIKRVNELNQEFSYAHPLTKIKVNKLFNTHFYGSQLWDLLSNEAVRLEKTWNTSHRILLGIPRDSHRYFIEPLTETPHIKFTLLKRFLKFVESIQSSEKMVLKKMLAMIKQDCRSTTGRNLRKIMLLLGKTDFDKISSDDFRDQIYVQVPSEEEWKIHLAKELLQAKNDEVVIDNFTHGQLDEILNTILTS